MKVKELIEKLKTMEPELDVYIAGDPEEDFEYWTLHTARQIAIDLPDEDLIEEPVVVLERT